MNISEWQFSEEVKLELDKFLAVVNERVNKNNDVQNVIQCICQELNSTKENKHLEQQNIDTIIPSEKTNHEQTLNYSVANITINLIESEPKVLSTDLYDIIKYVLEALENKNSSLRIEEILKLNSYDEFHLNHFFMTLSQSLSDEAFNSFNHSLCLYNDSVSDLVSKLYSRHVLVVKLENNEPSFLLKSIIKEFIETYSCVTRTDLLIPLIQNEHTIKWLQIIINTFLSDTEKQQFLREYLFSCNKLEVWQLSTIESLLFPQTEGSVKCRLINVMDMSADTFANEKLFMKLIMTLLKYLDNIEIDDQGQILNRIIEKNQTVLKVSARKLLLNHCNKNYN